MPRNRTLYCVIEFEVTMKKSTYLLSLLLIGCTQNLADYTPVVDPHRTDMNKFHSDLIQCRGIAVQAKANYEKQASQAAATGIVVGAVVGAAVGSSVGAGTGYQGDMTRLGSAQGAAMGALSASDYAGVAKFGPNRIVDRCMANRGYEILNDVGFGTN